MRVNVNDSFDYWRPLLLYMYKMGKGCPFPEGTCPFGIDPFKQLATSQ